LPIDTYVIRHHFPLDAFVISTFLSSRRKERSYMFKPSKIPPDGRNDKTHCHSRRFCHLDERRDLTCLSPARFLPMVGMTKPTVLSTRCHLDDRRDLTCLSPTRFLPLVGMTKPTVISTLLSSRRKERSYMLKPCKIRPAGQSDNSWLAWRFLTVLI
jgi:hypothetical protein